MIRKIHFLVSVAGACLLVAGYLFWKYESEGDHERSRAGRDSTTIDLGVTKQQWMTTSASGVSMVDVRAMKDIRGRLDLALDALKDVATPAEAQRILSELRVHLASVPSETASKVITDVLRRPDFDAPTLIEFSIGKAKFLNGQPSFRIALLDWLGQIDPDKAGIIAEEILETPTRPDEWAVCLRNYAHANPNSYGREFLRAKTEELIRNEEWSANPSIGFLESFDVLVHTRAVESSRLLSELVEDTSSDGKALGYAAFLTMDRLTILEPVAMMQQLAAQPELINARGPMVASLFARADLRDIEQRQLVRDYLLSPARTTEELEAFAGVYPNANFVVSDNLLTQIETPARDEIVAHDAVAYQLIEDWLRDEALESVKPTLRIIRDRLASFLMEE